MSDNSIQNDQIVNERRERPNRIAMVALFGICLLMSLELPLDTTTRSPISLTAHAVVSIVMIISFLFFFTSETIHRYFRPPSYLTAHRVAATLCLISFVVSTTFIYFKLPLLTAGVFPGSLSFWMAILFFIALFVFQISIRRAGFPSTVLFTAIAAYLFLLYYHFTQLPYSEAINDQYSLVFNVIDRFVIGLDPYQVYDTTNDRPFTVLPGNWLVYFFPKIFAFDPRWIGGISFIFSTLLIYLASPKQKKHLTSYCLSIFILCPSLLAGDKFQTGLLSLAIALLYFFISKQLNLLALAVLAWSLSISFFSWLLIPFVFALLLAKQKIRYSIVYLSILIFYTVLFLGPFAYAYPDSFYYCVMGYWLENYFWNGVNLSYFLLPYIGGIGLYFLQIFFFLTVFTQYLKSRIGYSTCFIYFSIYALFFTLVNRVVEAYIYPLILMAAIIGFVQSTEAEAFRPRINIFKSSAIKNSDAEK